MIGKAGGSQGKGHCNCRQRDGKRLQAWPASDIGCPRGRFGDSVLIQIDQLLMRHAIERPHNVICYTKKQLFKDGRWAFVFFDEVSPEFFSRHRIITHDRCRVARKELGRRLSLELHRTLNIRSKQIIRKFA